MSVLAPLLRDLPQLDFDGLTVFVETMPGFLRPEFAHYDEVQMLIVLSFAYLVAPMYLILLQMVASVIAADSFKVITKEVAPDGC